MFTRIRTVARAGVCVARASVRVMAATLCSRVQTLYAAAMVGLGLVLAETPQVFAAACAPGAGGTGIGAAFTGVTGLLLHIAAPATGLGFVSGGVWHSVTHDPRAQESAKQIMKGSLIGLAGSLLASGIITTLGTTICG